MPTIHDLPVEFLTDNLLPFLPIRDGTSRSFANVCSDDLFWRRKLKIDYNFDGKGSLN
jgi:SCF-associated factor 1